jgi:hypothetical protein
LLIGLSLYSNDGLYLNRSWQQSGKKSTSIQAPPTSNINLFPFGPR